MLKRFLYWLWLQTMTVDKYKKYLNRENIKENEMCYSVDENECDGRCQGCCSCPWAEGNKISKKRMMIYQIQCIEDHKAWKKFEKELDNDAEWQKTMKELREQFKKNI